MKFNLSNIIISRFFILVIVLITTITVYSYYPSLNNKFTNWDDTGILVENVFTHNLSFRNLKSIFIIDKNIKLPLSEYLPLTIFNYTIEHHFFGLNPKVYHITNLIFHIFNSLLVFLFIYTISRKKWTAFWVSIFFAVHTLNVEPVAWITGRKDVLSAFFYLLSILSYAISLQKKERKIEWLTIIFFVLALLSKPSAVSLPLILILCDYLSIKKISIQLFFEKWYYFAISAIFTLIAIYGQNSTNSISAINLRNIFQNVLTACRGITFYICKGFMPINLSAVYPRNYNISFWEPQYFFSVFIVIILIYIIRLCYKKYKYISFGLLFFIAALLPILQFIPVGVHIYAADRFFYIPSIGLFFAIIVAIFKITKNNKRLNRILAIIGTGLVILLIGATQTRGMIWKSSGTLWKNVTKQFPDFALAHNSLGAYYCDNKSYSKAKKQFETVLTYTKNVPFPYHNLGMISLIENNVSQAVYYAEKEIILKPNSKDGWFLLGECNIKLSNKYKAFMCYKKGFQLDPYDIKTRERFVITCLNLGETKEAIRQLEIIISLEPKNVSAYLNLAKLHEELGNNILAEKYYKHLTKIDNRNWDNLYKLAVCQQKNGETDDALKSYEEFLKHVTNNANAYCNISLIHKAQNNLVKSSKYIEKASQINTNSASIFYNYACIAAVSGDTNTALSKLKRAIQIQPSLRNNASKDKDFISLKNSPEFQNIINSAYHN